MARKGDSKGYSVNRPMSWWAARNISYSGRASEGGGGVIDPEITPFTMDTTLITFDSGTRTMDEAS